MSARAVVPAGPVAAKARVVTHAPNALLQRKCDCGGSAGLEGECEECKKKKLQRRATAPGPAAAPPIVHEVLRSSGQPLDERTRSFFEPRFGHDFSKVRVHTDARAAESARAVKAQAYAVGNDLVFGAGHFDPETKSGQRLLAHELTHVLQQSQRRTATVQRKLEVGAADDSLEREADRFADQVTADRRVSSGCPVLPPANGANTRVQRAPDNSASDPGAPAAATVPPDIGLIVEDESTEVGPGQMRKSEFLDGLHDSLCATADAELAATGRTAQGCPFIERWIGKLRTRNGQYIERSIRKYAPRAASANAARDYFAAVGDQVRQGVRRWTSTGDMSGVPPELMSEMGGGGILGAIGGAVSGIGKLFAKAREGGAREANPAVIQAQLGQGASLEAGVRTRMESTFGHNFSRVRVHADSRSAELSSRVNARAFTIGNAVAFGAGEYRPGTLIGDALIAHELAHVMQQANGATEPLAQSANQYNSLEEDADISAVGAMVSLWRGAKSTLTSLGQNAGPRLRSGLRLQRCSKSEQQPEGSPSVRLPIGGKDASTDVTPPPTAEDTTQGSAAPPATVTIAAVEELGPETVRQCDTIFRWHIRWSTTGRDGYIVQEIDRARHMFPCSKGKKRSGSEIKLTGDPPGHFWEVWRVEADGTVSSPSDHDDWVLTAFPNTEGDWHVSGKAFWTHTLDPDAGFAVQSWDPGQQATLKQPKGLGPVLLSREKHGTWNCCESDTPSPGKPTPSQGKLGGGAVVGGSDGAAPAASGGTIGADQPAPPHSGGFESPTRSEIADSAADQPQLAAATSTADALIVEDDATAVARGQMGKTAFLEGLRASVCAAADEELAAVGRTAQGCPFIERWIAKMQSRSSQHIERAIRKYAPGAEKATAARDYFTAVSERVRRGVRHWAATGDLSDVPAELMNEMGGGGILGVISGALSGIGKLFAKAKEGGAREANPAAIQTQLGPGAALEAGVRTRMESAFGHSFSGVRVHADSRASALATGLNARAFAIGNNVAFAAGEYQPGTLIGDALIAHELAHVTQQVGGVASGPAPATSGAEYNNLEEDADLSAVGAMVRLWRSGEASLRTLGAQAAPRLRSGLRLQRCGGHTPEVKHAVQQGPAAKSGAARTPRTDAHGKECPDTVEIGETKAIPPFEKKMLDKGYRTYFGLITSMKVGPKPQYDACITEKLTTFEDTCGQQGNMSTQHHCGEKKYCLSVGNQGADRLNYVRLGPLPNAFVDLHESHSDLSVLDGSGKTDCKVTCLQKYACGGEEIGRFLITRHFKAAEFSDGGKKINITQGTIEKVPAPSN